MGVYSISTALTVSVNPRDVEYPGISVGDFLIGFLWWEDALLVWTALFHGWDPGLHGERRVCACFSVLPDCDKLWSAVSRVCLSCRNGQHLQTVSQNNPFLPPVAFFRHFVIATRKATNTTIHFILNRLPSSLTHSLTRTTAFWGQCRPIWQNSYLFLFALTISFLQATRQHSVPSFSEVNSSSSRPHIAGAYHIEWFSLAHIRFSSWLQS